jgi:molybdopterin-guanine dinucleotide biosynthesis protein
MQTKLIGCIRLGAKGMGERLPDLVEWFRLEGWSVSVVKYARDGFELNQPGKDCFRLSTPSRAAAGITRATKRRYVL